jgi:hypothetical protein
MAQLDDYGNPFPGDGTTETIDDPYELANISNAELRGDADPEVDVDPYETTRLDAEERLNEDGPTDKDVIITQTASGAVVGAEKPTPQMNPLHSYATSTYGITLFMLSKKDYNDLITGPDAWTPKNALISSGGGYKSVRDPAFHDDFYFDNLRMTTVIGLNANTRGTNAVEISFTVIEPYGLTLLDRIMDAATRLGSQNYLKQPYLLQIDFFGSSNLGDMQTPIPHLTKRIPVMLLEMKIKVGVKGSDYTLKAVPFNHSAFMESTNSTPANFEVKATTVGDFFEDLGANSIKEQKKQKDDQRIELEQQRQYNQTSEYVTASDQQRVASLEKQVSASFKAESYTGAWNAWNQELADKKTVKVANSIKFVIDDAIKNSKIVDDKASLNSSPMATVGAGGDKTNQKGNNPQISKGTPSNSFDPSKRLFNISAGSSIVDVVNLVMRNSEYIKSQVADPLAKETKFKEDTEVNVFKITSSVKIVDFDVERNEYAKETTYYISKYSYFNSKSPNLPKSDPPGAVKEYNYIYTGKNIDILDFSIDFDTAFYTTVIANRNIAEATSGQPGASDGSPETNPTTKPSGTGMALNTHRVVANDTTATSTGADSAKAMLVANSMKTIYSSSRGDMLNIKLKILGDPHFIKQDDVYTTPGGEATKMMLNPGTLAMDKGEIFCRITFTTPVDMDSGTGLTRKDSKYSAAGFSGFYRIIKVENEFSKGQFVQTLDCVRIFDKPTTKSTERPLTESEPLTALDAAWLESDPPLYDPDTAPTDVTVSEALDDELRQASDGVDYGTDADPQIEVSTAESAALAVSLTDAPTADSGDLNNFFG